MTLQFQPPNIPQAPSKTEALLTPVNNAIQSIPALWIQHQTRQLALENERRQHELQAMELELRKRQIESQFGTGLYENIQPGQVTKAPPPEAGPEEQMFGFEATPPTFTNETPEQKLRRLGTDAYKTLNPPDYGSFVMGPDGQPQLVKFPNGVKPGPAIAAPTPILNAQGQQVGTTAGKPTVLPKDSVPAPVANRFDTDFSKAYNFLSKVKGNLETLQSDIAAGDQGQPRKLTLGKFSPTASQGVVGSFTRAVGLGTPEQAAFASNVGKVNDLYRKEITGTQAGFTELQRLENRLPTTAEGEPQFIAKSNDTLNQGIQALEKELERAKAKGVDTGIYEQQLGELKNSVEGVGAKAKALKEAPSVGELFNGHKVLSVKRIK